MKRQAYTMIAALAFVMLIPCSTVRAQVANRTMAQIPFAFSVGDRQLPAGRYDVSVLNPGESIKIIRFRNDDGTAVALVTMRGISGDTADHSKLVFHRYGSQYFLSQLWTAGNDAGLEAARSKAERQADRELAKNERRDETVSLAKAN